MLSGAGGTHGQTGGCRRATLADRCPRLARRHAQRGDARPTLQELGSGPTSLGNNPHGEATSTMGRPHPRHMQGMYVCIHTRRGCVGRHGKFTSYTSMRAPAETRRDISGALDDCCYTMTLYSHIHKRTHCGMKEGTTQNKQRVGALLQPHHRQRPSRHRWYSSTPSPISYRSRQHTYADPGTVGPTLSLAITASPTRI